MKYWIININSEDWNTIMKYYSTIKFCTDQSHYSIINSTRHMFSKQSFFILKAHLRPKNAYNEKPTTPLILWCLQIVHLYMKREVSYQLLLPVTSEIDREVVEMRKICAAPILVDISAEEENGELCQACDAVPWSHTLDLYTLS